MFYAFLFWNTAIPYSEYSQYSKTVLVHSWQTRFLEYEDILSIFSSYAILFSFVADDFY